MAGLAARPWTLSWVVVVIALPASGWARAQSEPAEEPASPAVHLPRAVDATAIREALAGARRRLANESCRRLFTEFADESGRPLASTLDGLGETGASYLGRLSFENGDGRPRCEQRQVGVLAFTTPGSRVVHVCPGFAGVAHRYADEAEATIIHEALHTLGLRENPPSSRQIQDRVRALCPSRVSSR